MCGVCNWCVCVWHMCVVCGVGVVCAVCVTKCVCVCAVYVCVFQVLGNRSEWDKKDYTISYGTYFILFIFWVGTYILTAPTVLRVKSQAIYDWLKAVSNVVSPSPALHLAPFFLASLPSTISIFVQEAGISLPCHLLTATCLSHLGSLSFPHWCILLPSQPTCRSPLMFFPLAPLLSSVFHDPNTMSLMPDFSTGG